MQLWLRTIWLVKSSWENNNRVWKHRRHLRSRWNHCSYIKTSYAVKRLRWLRFSHLVISKGILQITEDIWNIWIRVYYYEVDKCILRGESCFCLTLGDGFFGIETLVNMVIQLVAVCRRTGWTNSYKAYHQKLCQKIQISFSYRYN